MQRVDGRYRVLAVGPSGISDAIGRFQFRSPKERTRQLAMFLQGSQPLVGMLECIMHGRWQRQGGELEW
jgi:hypothetical protein